jgi:hypothetical protein
MMGSCLDVVDSESLVVLPLVLAGVGVDAELASGGALASQAVLEVHVRSQAVVACQLAFPDFDVGWGSRPAAGWSD